MPDRIFHRMPAGVLSDAVGYMPVESGGTVSQRQTELFIK